MKKLLLVCFFFFSLLSIAQTNIYHSFPDSNAVWRSTCGGYPGSSCCYCTGGNCYVTYSIDIADSLGGDTLIAGLVYTKLFERSKRTDVFNGPSYCPSNCNPYTVSYSDYHCYSALRQDVQQKKVFLYDISLSQEQLLYDFNLQVGDTLLPSAIYYSEYNFVSKIDSVMIQGQYHKRFWLWSTMSGTSPSPSDSGYVALIEGVGSDYGLLGYILVEPFESGCMLNCFKINSVPVYPNSADAISCSTVFMSIDDKSMAPQVKLYPNPSSDKVTLQCEALAGKSSLVIMSITGEKVLDWVVQEKRTMINVSELQAGIYFVKLNHQKGTLYTKLIVSR